MSLDPQTRQQIDELLAACRTASLATADYDGRPHAANVQFVHDCQFNLYFVSSPNSAHALHVTARPEVAVTIYAHDDRPDQIHGLQFHGRCLLMEGGPRSQALRLYVSKFPFAAAPPFSEIIERQALYQIAPAWLRWIDNRRGFGFKIEMDWPPPD